MEIRVPDIGDFADVPVIEILVAEGDTVSPEDPLVTLESDKATMDVPSPAAGTVTKLLVNVEDRVAEGTVLLELETDEATSDAGNPSEPTTDDGSPREAKRDPGSEEPAREAPKTKTQAPTPRAEQAGDPESGSRTRDAQLVVIGAGPGGYTAAFRAADLGLKTILIDRDPVLGGVCLNVGCIPSKALLHAAKVITDAEDLGVHGVAFSAPKVDLQALLAWKSEVVGQLTGGLTQLAKGRKVEVVTGEARFLDAHRLDVGGREISFDYAILAAGSRPVKLPFLPEDDRVIDSTGALSPADIPKRLLVIGGGVIGLEMATVYDALGSRVTVVELADQLIPGADPDVVRPLQRRIAARYEAVLTGTSVTAAKAQRNGIKVSFSDGEDRIFDRVLVAVGRRPNGDQIDFGDSGLGADERGFVGVDAQLRSGVDSIFAIGDLVGQPMLAHKATYEAKIAAEVIAGQIAGKDPARLPIADSAAIPSVAYTDPEVAWMGLTETAAKAEGIAYVKRVIPWGASGRALGLGRPEGTTKLLFEEESGRLLGAGIVGVAAGDLITETVLALELGAGAEDMALTIHPHPTLSETVRFAAELQDGSITDLPQPRRR